MCRTMYGKPFNEKGDTSQQIMSVYKAGVLTDAGFVAADVTTKQPP